jgi:hypothetical protein
MVAEVAQARAHIGLAYNPPPHEQVSWVVSSRQPVVMLVHPQHPLALRGGPAELQDLQRYPLATMPASFGVGQVLQMLALVENLEVRPALTTPSLLALKRAATTRQFVTLTGEPRRAARDRRGRAGGRTRWRIRCSARRMRACWSRPGGLCPVPRPSCCAGCSACPCSPARPRPDARCASAREGPVQAQRPPGVGGCAAGPARVEVQRERVVEEVAQPRRWRTRKPSRQCSATPFHCGLGCHSSAAP